MQNCSLKVVVMHDSILAALCSFVGGVIMLVVCAVVSWCVSGSSLVKDYVVVVMGGPPDQTEGQRCSAINSFNCLL